MNTMEYASKTTKNQWKTNWSSAPSVRHSCLKDNLKCTKIHVNLILQLTNISPNLLGTSSVCPLKNRTFFQKQLPVQELHNAQYYQGNICYWCSQQIPRDQLEDHIYICGQKLQIDQDLLDYKFSEVQYKAITYLYRKSAMGHLESKENALAAVFNMGYSQGDLLLMSQFIEYQAPLIIHIDRVKYGVMNYANDKYGSMKCQKYGRSIIVLKQSLRKRCTIAHRRVYGSGEIVYTLKYNYPIIERCTQKELRVLYHASKGFQVESSDLQSFKEIHVHGPIRFSTDVQCIYTSKAQRQRNIDNVILFENNFGVKIIALQDLQDEH